MIETRIGNRIDAIRIIRVLLKKIEHKDGGIMADIKAGLEARLDAMEREAL